MPRTSHRLARLGAGLSVVAASSAATLLAAVPAHAATPVVVSKISTPSVSAMRIVGSDGGEGIRVSTLNGFVTVSNSIGSVQAGAGCLQLGGVVRCDGVTSMSYSGNGGDDSFRNDTSVRINSADGGAGSDRLFGGPADDRLRGGLGDDLVNGGGGTDSCEAEAESACERDIPPPPKVRVPR